MLPKNLESEPSNRYLGINGMLTKIPTPKTKSQMNFTPLKPLFLDKQLVTPEPVKLN